MTTVATGRPETVSVIIPTRDRPHFLAEALASVRRVRESLGGRATLDVVVVDDGSVSATLDVARREGARYLRNDGFGVSAARNTGLRNSTGGLVAFLDDDDVWTEHQLGVQLDALQADPRLGAVFGQTIATDARLRPEGEAWPSGALPHGDALLFFADHIVQIGAFLIRRAAAQTAGAFDEQLVSSEDWDWQLRLARAARVAGVAMPVVYVRKHRDPRSEDLSAWWRRRRSDTVAFRQVFGHLRSRLPLRERLRWQLGVSRVHGIDTSTALGQAAHCLERGDLSRVSEWIAAAWDISPAHTTRLLLQYRSLLPHAGAGGAGRPDPGAPPITQGPPPAPSSQSAARRRPGHVLTSGQPHDRPTRQLPADDD